MVEAMGDLDPAGKPPRGKSGADKLRSLSETFDRALREDRAEIERAGTSAPRRKPRNAGRTRAGTAASRCVSPPRAAQ